MSKKSKCPICSAAESQEFKPFCSARCQLIDLNKWLNGSYAIAGSEEEDLEKASENEETL